MDNLITIVLTIFTASISFAIATIVERRRKKREIVLEYLIEAFKGLYNVHALGLNSNTADDFNKAINLLGL